MTIENIEVTQQVTNVQVLQVPATNLQVTQQAPINIDITTPGPQGAIGPAPTLLAPTTATGAAGTNAIVGITGDPVSGYTLSFTIPRGNTGLTGNTGPAPTLNAPVVTTGIPGSSAEATWTGSNPYTLNLTVPRGSQTLSGTSAPASGTGSQGDWHINTVTWDVSEKTSSTVWTLRGNIKGATGNTGNTGLTGPANTLVVGTVTASAPGSTPVVNITGTSPNQTISFTLPRGDVGPIGPAPNIAGVSVTTGAAGSSASGSVTGTNPNYTLNLTIPRGDKGDIGAQWYTGAGAPSAGTGVNGDFYLVASGTGVGDVYKKVSGAWVSQGNIRGQAGSGDVESVNGILPVGGNVTLTWNDFTGTIPTSALPSLATVETYTVASQAAMLALSAQRGDLAIRTDLDETYILSGNDPTVLGNWTVLLTDGGNVRLTGDQTVGGIKTFSSAPVVPDASWTIAKTNGLQAALDAKQATIVAGTTSQYYRGDKTWQTLDKAAVGLSAVANLAQVDLVNAQTIAGVKTFSVAPVVPDSSFTIAKTANLQAALDGKAASTHVHAAADVNSGVFDIARIPTGTTGTTVALGNHLHTGVYEPLIAAGTTAQYRRGDNTWATLNVAAVAGAAPTASPTFTGTVTVPDASFTIAKTNGLQAALDLKAPLASPVFTGTVTAPTFSGSGASITGVVHTTGNESIAGIKTFTTGLTVDVGGGHSSSLGPNSLNFTRNSWNYIQATTVGGSIRIHGTVTTAADTLIADFAVGAVAINGSLIVNNLTASRVVTTGTGGLLGVSSVTTTELGYLAGVTSAIQTQLGNKEPTITAGTTTQYYRGDKTWQTLNVSAVSGAAPSASPTFTGTVTVPDGSFTIAKTTGLQAALDGKASATHTHTIANITSLQTTLDSKLAITQVTSDWNTAILPGMYWSQNGAAVSNRPNSGSANNSDTLYGTVYTNSASNRVIQVVQQDVNQRIFSRISYDGGSSWAAWTEFGGITQTTADATYTKNFGGGGEDWAATVGTSGSVTLNAASCNGWKFTPTGTVSAISLVNVPSTTNKIFSWTLVIEQGTTVRTIAWPSGWKWMSAQPTQAANKTCMVSLETWDGGTTIYASAVVQP